MKSKRYRAILKAKGYTKTKGCYVKACNCFTCKGTGKWAGWKSEGIYPHINTWYQELDTCHDCKGTGKGSDVTCIEMERD